jgi:hypothetical protein
LDVLKERFQLAHARAVAADTIELLCGGIGLQPNAQPLCTALATAPFMQSAPAEGAMLPDKEPATRSVGKNESSEQTPSSEVPTWPRLDLSPPEHMLSGLRDEGRIILASDRDDRILNDADRAVVKQAVRQLSDEPGLFALLRRVSDPALADEILHKVTAICGSAYVIGAHCSMTDTAQMFFAKSRATQMRIRRATSPEEQALRAAINAAAAANNIAIPSYQHYKDAERILSDVNKRLSEAGHRTASIDVIARRLRPRSSRARRK